MKEKCNEIDVSNRRYEVYGIVAKRYIVFQKYLRFYRVARINFQISIKLLSMRESGNM